MGNTKTSNPTPTATLQPLLEGRTITSAMIANAAQEYLHLIQINEDLVKERQNVIETVNDLELQLKKAKENIKFEQFKQANRKRVGQKSLDLNNTLSPMDEIDAEMNVQDIY